MNATIEIDNSKMVECKIIGRVITKRYRGEFQDSDLASKAGSGQWFAEIPGCSVTGAGLSPESAANDLAENIVSEQRRLSAVARAVRLSLACGS